MKELQLGDLYLKVSGIMMVDADLYGNLEVLRRQDIYALYNWLSDLILDDLIEEEKLQNG